MRLTAAFVFGPVIGATLVAVACSGSAAVQPQQATSAAAVPVSATAVVRKPMQLETSVIGTVEAFSTVIIRAQITGELTSVNFQQGDDVEAGQELFTLDRRPLEAALQQATANLERDTAQAINAKAIVQRYDQLVERGIVSREQRDTARASAAALEGTLAADRAAVENAKVQLQYATIRAPLSGRTGALMVNVGNLVRANDQAPLVTINQVTPIYASFAFPEALFPDLKRYMARGALRVEARPAQGDGPVEIGTITFVDNTVDQTTGTIKIKGTFPNSDRALWPGQFINAVVRLATESAVIVVPSIAVQTGPDGTYVYLVKADETVELRPITVTRVAGTEAVIRDGLAAGDRVVTDGHLRLVPGTHVSIRDGASVKTGS